MCVNRDPEHPHYAQPEAVSCTAATRCNRADGDPLRQKACCFDQFRKATQKRSLHPLETWRRRQTLTRSSGHGPARTPAAARRSTCKRALWRMGPMAWWSCVARHHTV